MENHVSGQVTANAETPDLGHLRRALLAVLLGNPLFSAAEQRQATHDAHACADPHHLTQWAHVLRHEAARRTRVAELRQRAAQGEPVCTDWVSQMAELEEVLAVRAAWRPADSQDMYRHLMGSPEAAFRVRVLGEAYLGLLEKGGFMRCKLLN